MPKVSVVVPIYGVEKYVERCARSLFEQTLDDIEYIFIDDCTPDNSIEILERVLDDYPQRKNQVIIHHMESNSGQAAVRKWGIQNATGDYLINCDSDDWVDRDMYRAMYEIAVKADADVAICDYMIHDGIRDLKARKGANSPDINSFAVKMLLQKYPWALWNKLFKRTVYVNDILYPSGNMAEDMIITSQFVLLSTRMVYVPCAYYYYFYNNLSITKRKDARTLIHNYESLKSNLELLVPIIKEKDIRYKRWIINGLQFNATAPLLTILRDNKEYRDLWMNTYPFTNFLYIFHFCMKIRMRIVCLLALVNLYPIKKKS